LPFQIFVGASALSKPEALLAIGSAKVEGFFETAKHKWEIEYDLAQPRIMGFENH
jgi:hypothetical protein